MKPLYNFIEGDATFLTILDEFIWKAKHSKMFPLDYVSKLRNRKPNLMELCHLQWNFNVFWVIPSSRGNDPRGTPSLLVGGIKFERTNYEIIEGKRGSCSLLGDLVEEKGKSCKIPSQELEFGGFFLSSSLSYLPISVGSCSVAP